MHLAFQLETSYTKTKEQTKLTFRDKKSQSLLTQAKRQEELVAVRPTIKKDII